VAASGPHNELVFARDAAPVGFGLRQRTLSTSGRQTVWQRRNQSKGSRVSALAVRAEGVGKEYRIGEAQRRHNTLRDRLASSAGQLSRQIRSLGVGRPERGTREDRFWALRDVSFELACGETLGIIGHNGAGKSTLLKILSRITEPTTGEMVVRGRVGSLLEVGTGFHSELTGRENVFLNGAILGMTRAEISRKFDEIVAFAEVERFIDTPVKHYSSGMYLRLGFAVAAHLEPEILIVDEVLAVGDAAFQKKCLGKMGDVAREGRTVVFVSHNLVAVRSLCTIGMVLQQGRVAASGPIQACMNYYAAQNNLSLSTSWERPADRPDVALTIDSLALELHGTQPNLELEMQITLVSRAHHKPALIAVDIRSLDGTPVMQALPEIEPFITANSAEHVLRLSIQLPGLIPGQYTTSVWVGSHNEAMLDTAEDVAMFEVHDSPTPGRTYPHTPGHGFIVPASRVTFRHLTPGLG
jgi:lipopolysaccharide transport system ATP-binding protein